MSDAGDIETRGKHFRAALPDAKYRRLFDQYIRSKSNPAVCANPDRLMAREDAILSAIKYYSAKFDIEYKDDAPLKDNEMDAFVKPAGTATTAKKPAAAVAPTKKPPAGTADAPAAKKPGRKPAAAAKKPAAGAGQASTPAPANLVATILEKEMERLTVEDVEIVRVTSFEHDGRKYYRDEKKGKIYATAPKGAVGGYIGRWNHRLETIETDIPDSDAGEE
jgi:hypothetical protein